MHEQVRDYGTGIIPQNDEQQRVLDVWMLERLFAWDTDGELKAYEEQLEQRALQLQRLDGKRGRFNRRPLS